MLPCLGCLQELAARKDLREVGGELLRHARTAAGSGSDSHGGASKRPAVVSPGSFLALVVPAIGRPVGSTGAVLTELWAVYQSAVFILAGGVK